MSHHDLRPYDDCRLSEPVHLEPLLTVAAVGQLLGVSRPTVYRLIRSGDLCPIVVGCRKRFRPEDVRRFLGRAEQLQPERKSG